MRDSEYVRGGGGGGGGMEGGGGGGGRERDGGKKRERERERERDRQTDRQTDRQRDRERQRQRKRKRWGRKKEREKESARGGEDFFLNNCGVVCKEKIKQTKRKENCNFSLSICDCFIFHFYRNSFQYFSFIYISPLSFAHGFHRSFFPLRVYNFLPSRGLVQKSFTKKKKKKKEKKGLTFQSHVITARYLYRKVLPFLSCCKTQYRPIQQRRFRSLSRPAPREFSVTLTCCVINNIG